MIARLLLLLLVYKTTRCDEVPATKTTLFVPVISEKCKYIKCSTQEDPKCVKLKNEKTGNSVYIIVLNKCEIRYMECVNGFDAKFVSMKYCGHQNLTMKVTSNRSNSTGISGKRRRRSKRRTRVRRAAHKQRFVYKSGKHKSRKDENNSYEGESGYKVRLHDDVDYYDSDGPEGTYWPKAKKLAGPRPIAALQNETGDGPIVLVGELPSRGVGQRPPAPEDKPHRFVPDPRITMNEDSFPLFSKETLDEHAMNRSADPDDGNTEQCPVSCQTRVQMVCGKCQHGIYKTFMSSCHMRMFSCQFAAETMELVSRYPCILSAPYIAEAGVPASSKVAVNIERDQVLSFIKCRSLGLLKTGDPRCPF